MITNDQAIGITVFVAVDHKGRVEHHLVPLTPKQASKLFNFIKHSVHGGQLTLTAETFPLGELLREEKKIIHGPLDA